MANSLSDSNGSKSRSIEDRNIKKERFKDNNANADMDMVMELPHELMLSWKDRLMGKGLIGSRRSARTARLEDDDDFKFLERDVTRSANPLDRNGYFLAKFQNKEDYENVLSHGPWVMYGQYLTMQPWIVDFSSSQLYPNIVVTWIRLSGLPGYMYK
ncbi:hypothetical protein Gorai_016644 [Gossypium raimondii]|uniref:DUF4283 domain-containing protein n=1 Tax=Gossypium raimondii TaxID=29730 RepID=A0A7J8P9N5_GOSRA|nr:hypothetical protein [Gossypium raimondii]